MKSNPYYLVLEGLVELTLEEDAFGEGNLTMVNHSKADVGIVEIATCFFLVNHLTNDMVDIDELFDKGLVKRISKREVA